MTFFEDFLRKSNRFTGKWDVVLFPGKYDPITKEEQSRIAQFVNQVIRNPQHACLFSENVELGLISDFKSEEQKLVDTIKYEMSFEDKEFITAKIFGYRMFQVNVRDLFWLAVNKSKEIIKTTKVFGADQKFKDEPVDSDQISYPDGVNPTFDASLSELKKTFDNANILVVLDPDTNDFVQDIDDEVVTFEDESLNVGFLVWKNKKEKINRLLGGVPNIGEIIKAIVLMDHDKPDPEDLKSFAFKYNLGNYLSDIRTIHFKVNGEKYPIAFMSVFPQMVIYEIDEDNKMDNYIFVMEMMKKMFLGDEYVEPEEELPK
jgi:hypothetical protein